MKNELRKKAKNIRKLKSSVYKNEKVIKNLLSISEYKNAKNVLSYYPKDDEISTISLFRDSGKTFYLPRVNKEDLEICLYDENQLQCGYFGIKEPSGDKTDDLNKIDVVIIPALACDINGYRLGYGKGFYDRFLPRLSDNCKKIVLTYNDLIFSSVYPQIHDVKCDIVVCENYILNFNC